MKEEEETAQNVSFIDTERNRVEPIIIDSAKKITTKKIASFPLAAMSLKVLTQQKRCRGNSHVQIN